jgi:hypothetical protein
LFLPFCSFKQGVDSQLLSFFLHLFSFQNITHCQCWNLFDETCGRLAQYHWPLAIAVPLNVQKGIPAVPDRAEHSVFSKNRQMGLSHHPLIPIEKTEI